MTKNIERIEGIKLSLEFVKIFTPSGIRGFRFFFHLKFSSLEVRELCDSRTGRTVCKLTSIIRREGKVRVTLCNFPLFCVFCFISSHSLRRHFPVWCHGAGINTSTLLELFWSLSKDCFTLDIIK